MSFMVAVLIVHAIPYCDNRRAGSNGDDDDGSDDIWTVGRNVFVVVVQMTVVVFALLPSQKNLRFWFYLFDSYDSIILWPYISVCWIFINFIFKVDLATGNELLNYGSNLILALSPRGFLNIFVWNEIEYWWSYPKTFTNF